MKNSRWSGDPVRKQTPGWTNRKQEGLHEEGEGRGADHTAGAPDTGDLQGNTDPHNIWF